MQNVKLFVDFWNFQLRWNDQMSPTPPASRTKLAWDKLPSVLLAELPGIFGGPDSKSASGIES